MRRRDESGVVLLLVMVLIAVSISIAYAAAKTSNVDVLSARQREHLARAQVLARSGVAIATRALLDDLNSQGGQGQAQGAAGAAPAAPVDGPDDAWALLGRQPIELEDGGVLEIHVSDLGARIGINALLDKDGNRIPTRSREFLDAALEVILKSTRELRQLNIGDEKRGDLADAILDWMDKDDVTRMGSPEAKFYEHAAGKPLNRPLLSIDELAGVPGMDPLLLEALEAYFSPYPRYPTEGMSGGINPNTAPPHVLSLLYYGPLEDKRMIDEDHVIHVLKLRASGNRFCSSGAAQAQQDKCLDFATEMGGIDDPFPTLSYGGSVFTIDVEARYQNARACIHSVIDRSFPQTPAVLLQRLDC